FDRLARNIQAYDVVAAPGQFEAVPASAAGNVQDARARFFGELTFQIIDLRDRRHPFGELAPHLDGDAFEESLEPVGVRRRVHVSGECGAQSGTCWSLATWSGQRK